MACGCCALIKALPSSSRGPFPLHCDSVSATGVQISSIAAELFHIQHNRIEQDGKDISRIYRRPFKADKVRTLSQPASQHQTLNAARA